MLEFLNGAAATATIRSLVATSGEAYLAVAFWGSGAAHELGLKDRANSKKGGFSTKIVCNLQSGATNPGEIRELLNVGIEVLQSDKLHGKIYLFDDRLLLGSSNASSNGLALQGAETSGWHEANLSTDDKKIREDVVSWLNALPKRAITEADLQAAEVEFRKQRRSLSPQWPAGTTLLQALEQHQESFLGKNIFVTIYSEEFGERQERAIRRENKLQENAGIEISGVGYELQPSSSYVGFWHHGKSKGFEFESFFRTRDYVWTNGEVWFCEVIPSVLGIRKLGGKREWSRALAAAVADIEAGVIEDTPLDICDFYRRYLRSPAA
jgi:hypothetical protein